MLTQLRPQDKRHHDRLPAVDLIAQLKSKQGLFSTWLDLEVLDFSPFGIGLNLPTEPELGQKVTLRLLLNLDMGGNLKVQSIEAKIVNKVLMDDNSGNWRVGFVFTTQSKQSQDNDLQLKRMHQLLERNAAVKKRLQQRKVG